MRFEEIGIKDEGELEQDEFSLSRPQFGKDNQVTVIGWKGRSNSTKYYIVKCSRCAKDPELYGNGVFRIPFGSLNKGSYPCGCSKSPTYSEYQYKILIERKCKEKGYIFHGFSEDFKRQETKLKLECPKHGMWYSTNAKCFIHRKAGCPQCGRDSTISASYKEDTAHYEDFMSTGKFKEGTKFWRSERKSIKGAQAYWNYTCPICSNDEYVQNGLCSGVFESHVGHLFNGGVSCRCIHNYRWTKDQTEYRIKKKMQESKTANEFIGFIGEYKNQQAFFTRECKIHGYYNTRVDFYMHKGGSCPSCSRNSQQECYINLVKDGNRLIALKFGIAIDSSKRVKSQNSQSIFDVEQYGVWSFSDIKSCKAAEKFIKQNLVCNILTKQELSDGFTETTSVDNLEEIIKIYEDFGGVFIK